MPTCVVTGCRNGYKPKKNEKSDGGTKEKIHWHKFPADSEKLNVWKCKIPRKHWQLTEHTRICNKHFLPTDYESERTDKQSRRKKRKRELVLWKLKADAVPSVWSDLPNHLTKKTPTPRPTVLSTSEARELNIQAVEERRELDRLAEDSFTSLQELKDKIAGIQDLPTNTIIDQENRILFAAIKYFDKPVIEYCLVS